MSERRAKLFRWFRNAASVACVVGCVVLIFFWIRSYKMADRLHFGLWGDQSFVVASKEGRLILAGYKTHPYPNGWKTGVYSFPVDDDEAFPIAIRDYEAAAGFGFIRQPMYYVPKVVEPMPDGKVTIYNAGFGNLQGSGVIVPYWFAVLGSLVGLVLTVAKRPWRYSTRTLLITVTVIAVLLGLIAVLDGGDPAKSPPPPAY